MNSLRKQTGTTPAEESRPVCGCGEGFLQRESLHPDTMRHFVTGFVETPSGPVPVVDSNLTRADRFGAVRIRLGIGRMNYSIDPGLYALGSPNENSPVLVTANYKLSFDCLRSSLPGRSAWILVLDTRGINVWCAAGKGTFGTDELVSKVESVRLSETVKHRNLIVPQLGAPGVAAHSVRRQCGFKVVYGPVGASDIPEFLDSGCHATPVMRNKTFDLKERAVLIGVELGTVIKFGFPVCLAVLFLAGVGWSGSFRLNMLQHGLIGVSSLMAAILAGTVLTPLLLPWLPGRAFSLKGLSAGIVPAVVNGVIWLPSSFTAPVYLEFAGWLLIGAALTAFLAMNFTGCSTYTSLAGVKKEMRLALPVETAGAVAGLLLVVLARFVH